MAPMVLEVSQVDSWAAGCRGGVARVMVTVMARVRVVGKAQLRHTAPLLALGPMVATSGPCWLSQAMASAS